MTATTPIVGCRCWAYTTTPAQIRVSIEILEVDAQTDHGWLVFGRRRIASKEGPAVLTNPLRYFIPNEWLAKQHRGHYYDG